jgi:DnaA-homolog protein
VRQLPLGVRLQDRALFQSFVPGPNGAALAAAQELAAGAVDGVTGRRSDPPLLYLHGIEGSGKSHLLQAMCAVVPGATYLPLSLLRELDATALDGLATRPLLAIDDPAAVAGDAPWERRLFMLYNECQASGAALAVAANVPAVDLPLALPDLRSRLAAMPHFALKVLDETQQREALRVRAAARGIELPEETLQYLQRRFARDIGSLHALLEKLDMASLEAQRPLTVPFIRRVLGDVT